MARTWTPEAKARQAELIRLWRPWEKSTGPRTDAGKLASSDNRRAALVQAEAELRRAQEKVKRLHGGRESVPGWLAALLKASKGRFDGL